MTQKVPKRSGRESLSAIDLFRVFPDESATRKWIENIRWAGGQRDCPHCGSLKTSPVKNEKPMPYHCGECREYFSVKTGTVMQSSKVPLQKWVIAIHLLSTSPKGVSSSMLHRDLGVTQKTAWALAKKIREGWIDGGGKLTGSVEFDETYIRGKGRTKHRAKRLRIGRGIVRGGAIIEAKKHDGGNKIRVVEKMDAATLQRFAISNVEVESTVFTDERGGYKGLAASFRHESVKRGASEYVKGMTHTNGIESFWAMLKRGCKGTYHKMSVEYFARYFIEFVGRQNVGNPDALAQMVAFVRGLHSKRLRYDDLVAANV